MDVCFFRHAEGSAAEAILHELQDTMYALALQLNNDALVPKDQAMFRSTTKVSIPLSGK